MSTGSSRPWWHYAGFVLLQGLIMGGSVWTALYITLPKRNEEALAAALNANTKAFELAEKKKSSEPKSLLLDTNVKQAGHELKKALTPVVQISPKITQSISCEDVREIRLRVVMENLSESEANISGVNVKVASGAPIGDAQSDLYLTQRFYYQRKAADSNFVELAPKRSVPHSVKVPKAPAETGEKAPRAPAEVDDIPRVPEESTPLLSPVPAIAQTSGTKAQQRFPLNENDPLSNLPAHDCRHGRIFAVGLKSKDINWTDVERADQSFPTREKLGPKQQAQHDFVFVVTEFPDQHNRQWYHFAVQVAYRASEANAENQVQQVDLIVPGLPLPCCSETAQPISAESKTCKNCGGNLEPDAPSLSTRREAAPSAPVEASTPRTLIPDDSGAKSIKPVK